MWHYIKCRRQDKVGIGNLNAADGIAVILPDEKAQLLNDQFESVFTSEDLQNLPSKENSPHSSMPEIIITTPILEFSNFYLGLTHAKPQALILYLPMS